MEDLESVADEIRQFLDTLTAGSVLALWRDGAFTVEHFAFWGRRLPDGTMELPLATFVAGGGRPGKQEILEKLREAVEGLDPPAEPGT